MKKRLSIPIIITWQRDFGQMRKYMNFGEGSSPFLYGDKLFIQWDHEGDSSLYALDKKNGEIDWQHKRDEGTSWSIPLVVEVSGKIQVITSVTNQVRAYDYHTGEIIWTSTGLIRNTIPNPIYADGIHCVMGGFRDTAMQVIEISRAWDYISGTGASNRLDDNFHASPVVADNELILRIQIVILFF
jgi:outer membrane protein assembly factor BamB